MALKGTGSAGQGFAGGPGSIPPTPGSSVMNTFVGGFKTEFTGMTFPENSAVAMSNCKVQLPGNITRRAGIDFETGSIAITSPPEGFAYSSYKWNNVGGDGLTQMLVQQAGEVIYFFKSSAATTTSPLSNQVLVSTIRLPVYQAPGNTNETGVSECQFTDGNGFLIVFHPDCDPFYCTYNSTNNSVTANRIQMKIRDFVGIPDSLGLTVRPLSLSNEHLYNLYNQGWIASNVWNVSGGPVGGSQLAAGTRTVNVQTGLTGITGQFSGVYTVLPGVYSGPGFTETVTNPFNEFFSGNVINYNGSTGVLTINITSSGVSSIYNGNFTIASINQNLINTWFSAESNYPSDADIWWLYKNSSGVFSPSTTAANVSQGVGQAPQGAFILPAFNQDRSSISGVPGITAIVTTSRPKTGTWFQGRVWYSGVDASAQPAGDAPFTTWTENIYFSQIVVTPAQFGNCFQQNDPSSQDFFDLLPDDGGVISIPGSGSIYKLFPLTNGLLVFAANGIWFITGNTGLGFTATDFVVSKISNVQSISGKSFINVLGYPVFWNEEGIYTVTPNQTNTPYGFGGLAVTDMTLRTIKSFYSKIPLQSKKFARGDYNPITFTISWCYRSTNELPVNPVDRYLMDSTLNINTAYNAFFPYSVVVPESGGIITGNTPFITDIKYIAGPGGSTSPSPVFKYLTIFNLAAPISSFTYSEEKDNVNFVDFFSQGGGGVQYTSFFQAGYNLHGGALVKWRPEYVMVYSANNTAYSVQCLRDYAFNVNTGRFSNPQVITNPQSISFVSGNPPNDVQDYVIRPRRHRTRGNGYVYQLFVSSVPGQNFDIHGWALYESKNLVP